MAMTTPKSRHFAITPSSFVQYRQYNRWILVEKVLLPRVDVSGIVCSMHLNKSQREAFLSLALWFVMS